MEEALIWGSKCIWVSESGDWEGKDKEKRMGAFWADGVAWEKF